MTTNNPSNVTGQQSQGDATTNPPANVATTASQGEQGNPSIEELQRKLVELERDNKKYRTERKQQEEAAALATQKQLEEQGQFKALAEQHAARVQQLEPIQQDYTELSVLISQQIDDETKDWPKSVKAMDPGKDAPIRQRLAWRNSAHAVVVEMQQTQRGSQPGNSPGPKPASGEATRQQQKDRFKEERVRGGLYGL